MKSIRKIAGKVTALRVALAAKAALMSPYDANAKNISHLGGGGAKCGWNHSAESYVYRTDYSNSGSGSVGVNSSKCSVRIEGGGARNSNHYKRIGSLCLNGSFLTCDFSNSCNTPTSSSFSI